MKKMVKAKKTGGEILAVNEIFEKNPNTVKNYAIWLRYRSRSDQHNMYKEYRDMTINGAVSQMSAARWHEHRETSAAGEPASSHMCHLKDLSRSLDSGRIALCAQVPRDGWPSPWPGRVDHHHEDGDHPGREGAP